eukprot:1161608-Pelagomonas_calceolata.AAC.13
MVIHAGTSMPSAHTHNSCYCCTCRPSVQPDFPKIQKGILAPHLHAAASLRVHHSLPSAPAPVQSIPSLPSPHPPPGFPYLCPQTSFPGRPLQQSSPHDSRPAAAAVARRCCVSPSDGNEAGVAACVCARLLEQGPWAPWRKSA